MRFCIRLLRSVCSQGDEVILADLSDQNAIAELVGKSPCSFLGTVFRVGMYSNSNLTHLILVAYAVVGDCCSFFICNTPISLYLKESTTLKSIPSRLRLLRGVKGL